MRPRRIFDAPVTKGSRALKRLLVTGLSIALLAGGQTIGSASRAAAADVVPVACSASGAWFTEDVAPQVTEGGLLFAGPNAKSVNYYVPMSGNLQGIVDSSMMISAADGYQVALVWEINRFGTSGYATITAEPYMNGWVAGQEGLFTVTQDTNVWTSKIASGPGSQSLPIALKDMAALFPENVLLTEGLHLGTNSVEGQSSLVSALTGCVTESSTWVSAGTPTITGTPAVGARLTAVPGTWAPAGVQLSYQWLLDGTPIVGATGVTYPPVVGDVGHTLAVAVTGMKDGYGSVMTTSDPTSKVFVLPSVTAGSVSITGSVEVGSVLTAATSDWAPVGVVFSYQWLRDGVTPIVGATGVTYTSVGADLGHTLAANVTGAMDGYLAVSVVSPLTANVAPAPGSFWALSPSRLLDTRVTGPKAGAGQTRSLKVTGVGGVPDSGVSAVVLTVTVTETTSGGYLTVSPTGTARPVVSNLNWSAGATIPNAVTVRVGTGGSIDLFQSGPGTAQVIVDVAGYYVEGTVDQPGGFTSLTPARMLDTRTEGGTLASGESRDLTILGAQGVPAANVSAVVLNVTVTETTANGYLTVYPSGGARPTASNLNWAPGLTIPNLVTVKVGSNGKVSLFQSGSGTAQAVVDVAGYYLDGDATLPGMFVALAPSRVLDSRTASPVAANSALSLPILGKQGVPATGVSAVVINTTVTETRAHGFLTVYPGDPRPTASNLNWSAAGTTIPNLVTVKVGSNGSIKIYNGSTGTTQVVADIAGYYIGS